MRHKRSIVTFILSICLAILCNTFTAFAANSEMNSKDEWVLNVFLHPEQYQLLDVNGTDITEEFYDNNLNYYQSGNYETIYVNFDNLVYSGSRSLPDIKIQTRADVGPGGGYTGTFSYKHEIYNKVYVSITQDNEEVLYHATGTYQLINGECTSISGARFSLDSYTRDAMGTYYTPTLYGPTSTGYPNIKKIQYSTQLHVTSIFGESTITNRIYNDGLLTDTYI